MSFISNTQTNTNTHIYHHNLCEKIMCLCRCSDHNNVKMNLKRSGEDTCVSVFCTSVVLCY